MTAWSAYIQRALQRSQQLGKHSQGIGTVVDQSTLLDMMSVYPLTELPLTPHSTSSRYLLSLE